MFNTAAYRIVFVFSIALLCSATQSPATDAPENLAQAQARIALLEKQVQALRAQIKMLQSELAAAHAQAQQSAGELNAADGNTMPEIEAETEDTDKTDEALNNTSAKVYRSAITIFSELPANARPHPQTGWSKVARSNAFQWLKEKPIGATFKRRVKVVSVKVSRNTFDKSDAPRTWLIDLQVEREESTYLGTSVTARFCTINPYIRLKGDDAFAERANNVKVGSLAEITGTIKNVSFRYTEYPNGNRDVNTIITLDNISARVPGLTR